MTNEEIIALIAETFAYDEHIGDILESFYMLCDKLDVDIPEWVDDGYETYFGDVATYFHIKGVREKQYVDEEVVELLKERECNA